MYELAPAYEKLREKAFDWEDKSVPAGKPTGFVLETGYPEAVFTLIAMSDGAVSLYFSNGGGTIGLGEHKGPAEAARQLLSLAASFTESMPGANATPIPQRGEARMYILLNEGMRGMSGAEVDFGENRSKFSPLFHAAHSLIGEISRAPT